MLSTIRAIALDVDGVLTDGGVSWSTDGHETKRFFFPDIMGVSLARKAGLIIALISGEDSPLIDRFADKLGITDIDKGCKNKGEAVRRFAHRHALTPDEICFMGDDVNDLSAFDAVGLSAAPATAHPRVLERADFIATRGGGNGAVRELVDAVLAARAAEHAGTR